MIKLFSKRTDNKRMKILFIQWESIGRADLEDAFIQEGHCLIYAPVSIEKQTYQELPEVERRLTEVIHSKKPDIVFTVNHYPAISNFCNRQKIRYVSWIYDSPFRRIYSQTVVNPCNIIYVFDKELYLEFHNAGISTVHYLPMAANTERLDSIQAGPDFSYDVSFVGSLYLEMDQPFTKMSDALPDYAKGYLDGLVAAQMRIQGYDFMEEVLGPIIHDLCKAYPMMREIGSIESEEYFYAQHVINRWITTVERIDLLDAVGGSYGGVDFFTYCKDFTLPNLRNHGSVSYEKEMPLVFKQSKINLNISRRGMKGGVPLRAFDIMGCGGFLLSNFQSGFLDMFIPGEDFVYYESKEDLLQKIGYYLSHEEERKAIAKSGHNKVAKEHTYRHRIKEMLDF